jgi:hypothetical protein
MHKGILLGLLASAIAVSAQDPHTVTLAAGTALKVRTSEELSSKKNHPGDTFRATLDEPLIIDEFIIANRGAQLEGRVVEADNPVHGKGPAYLTLELVRLSTEDGQQIDIQTAKFTKKGDSTAADTAGGAIIGGVLGTIIGAAAGGGKGAAIGAGAGAAAGAGGVMLAPSQPAVVKAETKITFKVDQSITITERLTN